MNDTSAPKQPYSVQLVGASSLNQEQCRAAELRFRMALESGVGGAPYVTPALQACMLARALMADLTPEEMQQSEHDAEREVIALWEKAEDQAIMTALKPLNQEAMAEARFEINI